MVTQEGDWWFCQPQIEMLEHKISLPVGSCNLALPLWGKSSASPTTTLSAAAVLPSLQCILQQNNMQRVL
ncbi:UDP-glucuronate:xylan alpha-glucuronosyltransferase 2 [Camellia lanceoleosa]|uniref:UDP-glucuronate:xylan alpha-glucuronosyltransferase 2 n=1 Tax=Camellia lanceoleosa TaxID=1840588 RepID=A0ACC0G0Z0_9ERIC|nr:UDP-glucuronate:xylan alpha-glucuronosyltransferase 2 [Camellia lanceoleosa]